MNKPSRKTTAIILILASVSTAVLPAISPVQAPQLLVADFIWSLTGVRTVTFSSSTSGGTSPYFIEWTFGDGGTGQGSPVIHPYAAEGSYAVNMSVLDSANNRAFKVQTVTVTNYTPGSFAVAGDIGPVGRPNDVSRQSLLRLGNTTGLNFFLADGYLAGGFYYRNEAAWCSDFQAHLPQGTGLVIVAGETDTGWTSVPFDDIIYDTNGNGVYNVGSDTLLFNGWGGSSKLAGPSDGSPIATDSRLVYVDSNSNHHWDQGEAVVYAYDGANTAMRDYYPVMVGPISSVGSTMSSDSKIRYFQRDNNAFYVRPQSNNDYEQYVKGCGPYFPPSSVVPGGWVGSGISCSNDPTFNTFPSCYGREYYFDCCGTVPQLRIIVASPTVQNITGKMGGLFGTCATGVYVCTWTYQKSTGNSSLTEQVAHYNWVASTIQGAYIAGLPYTMVVTFDQCLSVSGEECGQGYHHQSSISDGTLEADLLNLLLNNQVGGHRLTFLVNAET
ncbi:PKD domain-containing protein, partial [Candidatus Bathyarchaeota archaeon]